MGVPWIELVPGSQEARTVDGATAPLPPGAGWHGLFAGLVRIRPFEELFNRRWGFNAAVLLDEALDRQRLFVETQHYPGELLTPPPLRRTLALRCQRRPDRPDLLLSLLGKVWAERKNRAEEMAASYCHELRSILPFDYEMIPAANREEFALLAGWDILAQAANTSTLAAVERYLGVVAAGDERFYLLGAWNSAKFANEQIWRVLAACDLPVLWNVTLRPTVLTEFERATLVQQTRRLQKLAAELKQPEIQRYADLAGKAYERLSNGMEKPYLAYAHLAAPKGIPDYLPRAVGFALTHSDERAPASPGFQVMLPTNVREAESWQSLLYWLETEACLGGIPDPLLHNLHKLTDAYEANALFRLPYPPDTGIPNLVFAERLTNPR